MPDALPLVKLVTPGTHTVSICTCCLYAKKCKPNAVLKISRKKIRITFYFAFDLLRSKLGKCVLQT